MDGLPPGFVQATRDRHVVVTQERYESDAQRLLQAGSLYEYASRDSEARRLMGRGVAYAIALPVSHDRVVVRHNRHGGLLARLTGDLFLSPSRAPYELAVSLRLSDSGVPTPPMVMYGLASVAPFLCRADVVTREIAGGRDLASYMDQAEPVDARAAAWGATGRLVDELAAAGARHHDLNVKNVLLARVAGQLVAFALDVDRVTFVRPQSRQVREGNVRRLRRSARKWRDERGAVFDEECLCG